MQQQEQMSIPAKVEASEGSLAGQGEGAAGSQAPGFAAGKPPFPGKTEMLEDSLAGQNEGPPVPEHLASQQVF